MSRFVRPIDESDPANSYQPRVRRWPSFVQRGVRFRKVDGWPRGYEVTVSHFRIITSVAADYEVCVCVDDEGGEYHYSPWQFEGFAQQLARMVRT